MYSEKEIRSNKNHFREIFEKIYQADKELNQFLNRKKSLEKDLSDSVRNYTSSRIGDYSSIQLSDYYYSFNINNYDEDVIEKVFILRKSEDIFEQARAYYSLHHFKIEMSYNNSKSICGSSFGWFFKNANLKSVAVDAANTLCNLNDNKYALIAEDFRIQFDQIDVNSALNDFKNNMNEYCLLINEVCGIHLYTEEDPDEPNYHQLNQILKDTTNARNKLDSIQKDIDKLTENIAKKATLYAEAKSEQVLDEVSVDQLKNDIKGLRVNSLKDNGYQSIKDILHSSSWAISSIYGISENSAYEIMHYAKKIKENTKQSINLKFEPEHKTLEATRLLNEVYQYDNHLDLINTYNTIKSKNSASYSFTSQSNVSIQHSDWFQFTHEKKVKLVDFYKFLIGDRHQEYLQSVSDITSNWSITITNLTNEEAWQYYNLHSARIYSILDQVLPGLFGSGDTYYGLPEELAEEIKEECIFPDGLKTTLRVYQEWGVKYILHQKNVLLGDEMGLGKTLQAIATMVSLKNTGAKHFIVVCPAAVLVNWCREIFKHSKLNAIKVHGSNKRAEFKRWLRFGGVCVTTYETVKTLELPEDFTYTLLVVDEAHYIKNKNAQRTKSVIELGKKAERHLYMTGTALENKVDEMISLIDQLNPSIAEIAERYKYMASASTYREKIAPVYYRRKVEDVQKELPDLIIKEAWVSLNHMEREIYNDTLLSKSYQSIRKVSWNVDDLNYSSKAERLKNIIEDARDDGRRVIVFSFFLETIRKIREYLGDSCLPPITGSINSQKRQDIIDKFSDSEPGAVLVAQIQAGGTGLNIQAASVVVIAEPQLKPSIEHQAIARAHRMGQTSNVLVYRLLCENTVDEKLMDMLNEKQEIFDAFADESVAAGAQDQNEVSEKTFGKIVQEEIDRIIAEKENSTI